MPKQPEKRRFKKLQVNELSLVTTPAILTDEELEQNAGIPIIRIAPPKAVDAPVVRTRRVDRFYAEVESNEDLRAEVLRDFDEGENLIAALREVVDGAMTALMNHLGEQDVWWQFDAIRATMGEVLVSDFWYGDPLAARYYRIPYERAAGTPATYGTPVEVKLIAEDAPAEPATRTIQRNHMKIQGFKDGDVLVRFGATPDVSFEYAGAKVFTQDAEGNVGVTAGFFVDAEGLVNRVVPPAAVDAPAVAPPTPAPVEAPVARGGLSETQQQLVQMMAASGQSFKVEVTPGGGVTIETVERAAAPAAPAVPAAEPAPVIGDLAEVTRSLEAVNQRMHEIVQRQAGQSVGANDRAAEGAAAAAAAAASPSEAAQPQKLSGFFITPKLAELQKQLQN